LALAGVAVLITGSAVGVFLQGASRVVVICFAVGSGGLMIWVGLRERKRGMAMLRSRQIDANPEET